MDAPLTGRAATEALGVYVRLGAANARFDARAVARAVRSRSGRRLVLRSLGNALRLARPTLARRASRARTGRRISPAGLLASASPGRPRLPGAPAGG